ncbi:ataxin-10 isoform X2 [Pithys albifrons albifrons]|uniref:ataxin-10 isoform X2 n=1 Tax=Pithys albifrons albifrons TaxID=3385563 RepID=UPI003A5D0731
MAALSPALSPGRLQGLQALSRQLREPQRRNLGFISTSVHLIKLIHGMQSQEELSLTALRCSLQFLGNIAAGNGDSQDSLWKCAFPDLLLTCLSHGDQRVVSHTCTVLFSCLAPGRVRALLQPAGLPVALRVLGLCREQQQPDWPFLIVTEHLLRCPELVKALYAKLSNQERMTLLELMLAAVSEGSSASGEEPQVWGSHAAFLAGCFQESCAAVLGLAAAPGAQHEEALVVIRLLDVLCALSSTPGQLEHLQALPGLLCTAIDTLRLTHLAGKEAVNVFSANQAVTGQDEITHPAMGFKSHLIRLIGNLCYRNKANQDKVFELDAIPLILDNCSIDDNNPFVSQWAVLAIRNVTEQNERNQALIAGLEDQGLAQSSALHSLGLEMERQEGRVLLKAARTEPS